MAIENLIDWNVGNMPDEQLLAELLDMVAQHNPASFGLNEVGDRTPVLRRFCELAGYVLTQFRKGEQSSMVAILTRADVARQKSDAFQMTPRSKVGKLVAGSRRTGITASKWVAWQQVQILGLDLTLAVTHLTPSHQVKAVRRLVAIQMAKLVPWFTTRRRITLLSGDFNEAPNERWNLLAGLKLIADFFTGPSHGRRAIDIWWIRRRDLKRLAKAGIAVTVTPLDGYSSDHRPMMLTLTKDETHACPTCGLLHTPEG